MNFSLVSKKNTYTIDTHKKLLMIKDDFQDKNKRGKTVVQGIGSLII